MIFGYTHIIVTNNVYIQYSSSIYYSLLYLYSIYSIYYFYIRVCIIYIYIYDILFLHNYNCIYMSFFCIYLYTMYRWFYYLA